jgi:hypothetical protein
MVFDSFFPPAYVLQPVSAPGRMSWFGQPLNYHSLVRDVPRAGACGCGPCTCLKSCTALID